MKRTLLIVTSILVCLFAARRPAVADQVIADDLIVNGGTSSLCVGLDCVNGENFGFDTIRLKENNLRIHFDDTSSTGSFPANDWDITINDSANGGASYFGITDRTSGRRVATFMAGAPSNSLFVGANGNVGFGTATPVVELQTVDGDTPTLRLQQDGSQGFPAQTWDVASNEANFFIRDVTNGSKLPFRIKPNAPRNSIFVASTTGDIGMGTESPTSPVHVFRGDGTAQVLVEETKAVAGPQNMFELRNNGPVGFNMLNTDSNVRWRFAAQVDGFRVNIADAGDAGPEMTVFETGALQVGKNGTQQLFLDASGNLTIQGTLTEMSDVAAKEGFATVDGQSILARLQDLPITQWRYKKDTSQSPHLGPMAQDFYSAFGLGSDDKHISPRDVASVALVGVKELNQTLRQEIKALEGRVIELEAALARMLAAQASPRLAAVQQDQLH
jgi:hypothetical protein